MIDRREILEAASSLSLLPSVIEKDHVLGWLLVGINAHEELADSWLFKGGTCLQKCYFETYGFSEDLDFTRRNEDHVDEEFLRSVFEESTQESSRIAMLRSVWRIRAHEVLNAE
jgi:predicted nucleotidyltransferase component of viral defense system